MTRETVGLKELFKDSKPFASLNLSNYKSLIDVSSELTSNPVFLSDKFPVTDGEVLTINIENIGTDLFQGVCLGVAGFCQILETSKPHHDGHANRFNTYFIGEQNKSNFLKFFLWQETAKYVLKNLKVRVFTDQPFILVRNIWEGSYLIEKEVVNSITLSQEKGVLNQVSYDDEFRESEGEWKIRDHILGSEQWELADYYEGDGMIIEEIKNGRRYYCSDGDSPNSIIFTIKREAKT